MITREGLTDAGIIFASLLFCLAWPPAVAYGAAGLAWCGAWVIERVML